MLVKIGELDNGFVLTMLEDDIRSFNELNVFEYKPTMEEVLSAIANWHEKVKASRGDKDAKEEKKPKP